MHLSFLPSYTSLWMLEDGGAVHHSFLQVMLYISAEMILLVGLTTLYLVSCFIFIPGFTFRPKLYCTIPWSSNGMENVALQLWIIWWNGNSLEKTAWITLGSWMLATCSLRNAQKKSIHYHFMNNIAITHFFHSQENWRCIIWLK